MQKNLDTQENDIYGKFMSIILRSLWKRGMTVFSLPAFVLVARSWCDRWPSILRLLTSADFLLLQMLYSF
jgi:hypothetical protein